MQIAGSPCVVCNRNIGVARDGAGCVTCRAVYHRACAGGAVCPQCGDTTTSGSAPYAASNHAQPPSPRRPVGVTVITGLTYVGLPLGVLMAAIGFQRMEHEVEVGLSLTLIGLATAVMSVVLGRALSSARPWARHFVLWVYPVTLAMEIALGDNGVIEQGFSWWRFIAALAVYTASAFVLMRPDARAFFGKRQQTPAASV